MIGGSQIYSRP